MPTRSLPRREAVRWCTYNAHLYECLVTVLLAADQIEEAATAVNDRPPTNDCQRRRLHRAEYSENRPRISAVRPAIIRVPGQTVH